MNQARTTIAFAEFCNGAGLTGRETFVLAERLGWNGSPKTLRNIGGVIGRTQESVRRIESKAIQKARRMVSRDEDSLDEIREAMELPEFFTSTVNVIAVDSEETNRLKTKISNLSKDIKRLENLRNELQQDVKNLAANCIADALIRKAKSEENEFGREVKMILISDRDYQTWPKEFRHNRYKFVASEAVVPGKGIVVCKPDEGLNAWAKLPV